MVTGALPFDEPSLPKLFEKIQKADFHSPTYLSSGVVDLIRKILVADPKQRVSTADIKSHPWYCHLNTDDSCRIKETNSSQSSGQRPCRDLSFTSTSELKHIIATLLASLRELAFAAVANAKRGNRADGCRVKERWQIIFNRHSEG